MALIACPDCGKQVSDKATACPTCGHPIAHDSARPMPTPVSDGSARKEAQRPWAWVLIGAAAGLIIGSLLPWLTATVPIVGSISVTGTEGDGMLTLIGGVVLGAVGLVALNSGATTPALVVGWLIAASAGYVAFTDFVNATEAAADMTDETIGTASVGSGLVLAVIAAGAAFVGLFGLTTKTGSSSTGTGATASSKGESDALDEASKGGRRLAWWQIALAVVVVTLVAIGVVQSLADGDRDLGTGGTTTIEATVTDYRAAGSGNLRVEVTAINTGTEGATGWVCAVRASDAAGGFAGSGLVTGDRWLDPDESDSGVALLSVEGNEVAAVTEVSATSCQTR